MKRLRRDLAAAWANARRLVVVIFAAGLLAGLVLAWVTGLMPRAGRYTFHGGGTVTTRTDTMTGEVVIFGIDSAHQVFTRNVTEEAKAR